MKILLIFIFLLSSSFAQDLVKKYAADLCNCYEKIPADIIISSLEKKYIECTTTVRDKYYQKVKVKYKNEEGMSHFHYKVYLKVRYWSPHVVKVLTRVFRESKNMLPKDKDDELFTNWSINKVKTVTDPINFKTGKFELRGEGYKTVLLRDKKYQYEIDPVINDTAKLSVKWINKYEYEITFLQNQSAYNYWVKGDIYKVKILEVTNKSFTCVTMNISAPSKKAFKREYYKIE